jgi:glutamyl-tRNA synthetase
MSVTVRFAPSPTGFLHIGGARTALFNWLFARHHGGRFLLRIEDTDRQRSTSEAVDAIIDGLRWLELGWDGEVVLQSSRAERHAEAARALLAAGKAYNCYCTPEELAAMREKARAEGRAQLYDGTWRDRDPKEAPTGVKPAIRLKAPREGETVIRDHVQGSVTVANSQLDDLIILRSDGTPTYNLSVVVDDHDMAITHVIRGDDHLNNAFRQTQIYRALGWAVPEFAHVPLIHGPDGAKLSKRHGALGVEAYREMGYLPEALRNYLLRLGWSHGDDEIISTGDAIRWFDIDDIGKAPARFDFAKLASLNGHYIRRADDDQLLELILPLLGDALDEVRLSRLRAALPELKSRAKTTVELANVSKFMVSDRPIAIDSKAISIIDYKYIKYLNEFLSFFYINDWREPALEAAARGLADRAGVKLGEVAQPLRVAITGSTASPPLFKMMAILGREECLGRIADAIAAAGGKPSGI